MVYSENRQAHQDEFESLLSQTCEQIRQAYQNKAYTPAEFEEVVFVAMTQVAVGTIFEGTIRLISGHKFPDIVAYNYYGVEVKLTQQDHWTTMGNSILESCRIPGVERIYLLMGKLGGQMDVRFRVYYECVKDVAVTHSPRYLLDMNLPVGESVFDHLQLDYDHVRNAENPIQIFVDYYSKLLKPGEEPAWWMNPSQAQELKATPLRITFWKDLPKDMRVKILGEFFFLFPELFTGGSVKYEACALYLIKEYGVINASLRDVFSAGGKSIERFGEKTFKDCSSIYRHFNLAKESFVTALKTLPLEICQSYNPQYRHLSPLPEQRFTCWTKLFCASATKRSLHKAIVADIKTLI